MGAVKRSIGNILTIAGRELFTYFASPVAYVVIAFQFAVCSYIMFLICGSEQGLPIYSEGMEPAAAPAMFFTSFSHPVGI